MCLGHLIRDESGSLIYEKVHFSSDGLLHMTLRRGEGGGGSGRGRRVASLSSCHGDPLLLSVQPGVLWIIAEVSFSLPISRACPQSLDSGVM